MRREMHTIAAKPAIVTYHPAALLRQPQYKRPAWQDLQKLETILKEHRRNEQ
jgi:DNA polymerase